MLGAFFLILLLLLINQGLFSSLSKKHAFFSKKLMNQLFWYHIVFLGIYYSYTIFNRSDSIAYFDRVDLGSQNWLDYFGTGTTFIDFISYPFIKYFNFNYEMMMLLFAWMGYLGFVYA